MPGFAACASCKIVIVGVTDIVQSVTVAATGASRPRAAPPAHLAERGQDSRPAARSGRIVVRKTFRSACLGVTVFETMAFVSTVGFLVVFVVLFQKERASRKEEENAGRSV